MQNSSLKLMECDLLMKGLTLNRVSPYDVIFLS